MGLKILHSADWHLGSPFRQLGEAGRKQLRQRQLTIPEKIAELCRSSGCQLVLLAGDILEGAPDRDILDALYRGLEDCGVPVFLAPGNHDPLESSSAWLRQQWPENVHIFSREIEGVALPELDCRVWGAGFDSMDSPARLEGFHAHGPETWQLGLFHGDPVNPGAPCCPISKAQVRNSGLQYLALGHLHRKGSFTAGDTLCAWPGCLMGRGWDETGEKGLYLVELGEVPRLEFLPFPGLRFYDLTAAVDDGAAQALEALLPGGASEDFYRITLTGWGRVEEEELRARFSRIPNLFFRNRTQDPDSLWEGRGQDSLTGLLLQTLYEEVQAAQGRDRQQLLLAARLCRSLLEGREVILP